MLYPQMNEHRSIYSLDGFWKFRADEQRIGEQENWQQSIPYDREIAVPASWNEQCNDLMYFFGTGWYEKQFTAPKLEEGQALWIRIGSANYYSKVWVNGQLVGENEGAHLPFQFEISQFVKPGKLNTFTVSVNADILPDRLPPGAVEDEMIVGFKGQYPNNYYDFFPYAGIQRPVQLLVLPKAHIAKVVSEPSFTEKTGYANIRVELSEAINGEIQVSFDAGKQLKLTVKDGIASGQAVIEQVKLWSPEQPHLYTFELALYPEGSKEAADSYTLETGIRTAEVSGDKFLLNGQPIFLRGAGMHEDFPVIGKGLNHAVIVKDLGLMKWLGSNSLRTTHYPYSEEFLNFADRNGILVIGESPFVGFVKSHYKSEAMEKLAKKGLARMVDRDYNHPSIIAWSLANEPDSKDEGAGPFFKKLYDSVRALDPARPITFVNCVDTDIDTAMEHMDFVSLNRYHGWYEQAGQLDEGCKVLDEALDRCYRRFKKPVIITEFGADAIAGVHTDPAELFSEEYQADMITRQYEIIRSKPYAMGAHVWALCDFKTSQTPSRVVVNRKGLFTRERYPKLAAHRVKEQWAKEDGKLK